MPDLVDLPDVERPFCVSNGQAGTREAIPVGRKNAHGLKNVLDLDQDLTATVRADRVIDRLRGDGVLDKSS